MAWAEGLNVPFATDDRYVLNGLRFSDIPLPPSAVRITAHFA